jgi:hypothetical protein
MPEHDKLDLLVQQALASYANPGRESGLEERILARIAGENAPGPRRRWLPWAIALPVAAGLLVLLLLSTHRQTPPPLAHHLQAPSAQPTELADAGRESSTAPRPARRENTGGGLGLPRSRGNVDTGKALPLPKLDVFPTPQPLSPEEQALAVFAARATKTERQSLIEARAQADAPIRIAAIEVQPLNAPDNGDN